jgi:hypothetical protein
MFFFVASEAMTTVYHQFWIDMMLWDTLHWYDSR